jgi:exodeoxyribonuclease-3
MFKLASWNVNSLRVRQDQVMQWFESSNVDVLALQETKLIDEQFPAQTFHDQGLHVQFSGQKTYNGVAIVSRYPTSEVITDVPGFHDPQRRLLAATVGGIRLINLYVPNGAAVGTDKYEYKLEWLENITAFIQQQLGCYDHVAVVGDFNIAPDDRDVHSPEEWSGGVLVSPQERQAFSKLLELGLNDSFRKISQEGDCFSWWDYRAFSFRRNRGLRIDHILLSESLYSLCMDGGIDVAPRRSTRPSDHAPVWATLNLSA